MSWRENETEKTYNDDEVKARLEKELPKWYLENGWIRRKYKTSGWKGTLMVINTVGHLAEAAFHHPDLTASYAFVIVKLTNHAAKGITDKDFELARKLRKSSCGNPALKAVLWLVRLMMRVSNILNTISTRRPIMNEDTLNMEIRQFLKKVGISSQREIEQAIYAALDTQQLNGDETLPIKITLTMPDLDLHHHVSGQTEYY